MKINELTPEHFGRRIQINATRPATRGTLTDMRVATTRYEEPSLAGKTYFDEVWVTLSIDDVWIEPLKGRLTSVELLD